MCTSLLVLTNFCHVLSGKGSNLFSISFFNSNKSQMKTVVRFIAILSFILFSACKEQSKPIEKGLEAIEEKLKENTLAPTLWVNSRVLKAKNRLEKTEAGKVVWNAMEAHGGLKKWFTNGALSFRFNYKPLDGSTQRDSYQTIDTWRNRAKHTSVIDSEAHFGWNGKTAWVKAKDSTAFVYDTKFWALTPIYFLGQPFILDGEGVNLELLTQKLYKEKNNDVVKVTFDSGTGDAPDDYYVLYFDADSHQLSVIRYIVSYPAYFKDGGHLPEKFMDLSDYKTVGGITFPTLYKTHWLAENEQPGEYITKIEVSDIEFVKNIKEDFFEVPEGAKIIE